MHMAPMAHGQNSARIKIAWCLIATRRHNMQHLMRRKRCANLCVVLFPCSIHFQQHSRNNNIKTRVLKRTRHQTYNCWRLTSSWSIISWDTAFFVIFPQHSQSDGVDDVAMRPWRLPTWEVRAHHCSVQQSCDNQNQAGHRCRKMTWDCHYQSNLYRHYQN